MWVKVEGEGRWGDGRDGGEGGTGNGGRGRRGNGDGEEGGDRTAHHDLSPVSHGENPNLKEVVPGQYEQPLALGRHDGGELLL